MRLKELREAQGRYQKDIASLLKIDRTTYVKYENGVSEPPLSTLIFLANYFDVSLDYLLENSDIPKPDSISNLSSTESSILTVFRELNDTGQRLVSDYCNMLVANPDFRKDQSSASAM